MVCLVQEVAAQDRSPLNVTSKCASYLGVSFGCVRECCNRGALF
jgi:hypothetical protein